MKTADLRKLIIAAAIASTMAFAVGSTVIQVGARDAHAGLGCTGLVQIAEKGSDGQETHG